MHSKQSHNQNRKSIKYMLQCGKCQQSNADTKTVDSTPDDSQNTKQQYEASSSHQSQYVFCFDCDLYLCESCDYELHVHEPMPHSSISDKNNESQVPAINQEPSSNLASQKSKKQNNFHKQSQKHAQSSQSSNRIQNDHEGNQQHSQNASASLSEALNMNRCQHKRKAICGECFSKVSEAKCPTCEQNFCEACWNLIHSRGTRLKHQKMPVEEPSILPPNSSRRNAGHTNHLGQDQETAATGSGEQNLQRSSSNTEIEESLQSQFMTGLSVSLADKELKFQPKAHSKLQNFMQPQLGPIQAQAIHPQKTAEGAETQPPVQHQNLAQYQYGSGANQAQNSSLPNHQPHQFNFHQSQAFIPQSVHQQFMNSYQNQNVIIPSFSPSQHLYNTSNFQELQQNQSYGQAQIHSLMNQNSQSTEQPTQGHEQVHPQQNFPGNQSTQVFHPGQQFLQQTIKIQTQQPQSSDDDHLSQNIQEEDHQVPSQRLSQQNQPMYAAFRQHTVSEDMSSTTFGANTTADQTFRSSVTASLEQHGQQNLINQGRFKQSSNNIEKSAHSQIQNRPSKYDKKALKEQQMYSASSGDQWTNANENNLYYNPMPVHMREGHQGVSEGTYRVKQTSSDKRGIQSVGSKQYQEFSAETKRGPYLRNKEAHAQVHIKPLSDNQSSGCNSDCGSDSVKLGSVKPNQHQTQKSFDYYGLSGKNQKQKNGINIRDKASTANSANVERKMSGHKNSHGSRGSESSPSQFNTEKNSKRGIVRLALSDPASSGGGHSESQRMFPGNQKSNVKDGNSYLGSQKSKQSSKFPKGQLVLNGSEVPKTERVPIQQPILEVSHKQMVQLAEEESKESINQEMKRIQILLFELAKSGELLVLKSDFVSLMKERFKYTDEKCQHVIEKGEHHGIIHHTVRLFANSNKIELVSLKITVLSHECLQWVITSLARDEMTPTEAAIKNRTKEAFALKIYEEQWDSVMISIKERSRLQQLSAMQYQQKSYNFQLKQPATGASIVNHRKTSDCSNDSDNSLFTGADTGGNVIRKNKITAEPENSLSPASPRFKIVELPASEEEQKNSSISPVVKAIYMEDEQVWQGVNIEDESTVDLELYQIMKEFLREYFCVSDATHSSSEGIESSQSRKTDPNPKTSSESSNTNTNETYGIGPDVRTIPGGRYGCTQYLKICGPKEIRDCSVGKTTQMVQLAIKKDVLRHHKTLIVWSTQVDKHKTEQDEIEDQHKVNVRKSKLAHVRQSLIEILAESKNGMSLAQLPQSLKKKLPFPLDLNELGFPKLKDLLKSMDDEIKIELKDVNHPFAYLVHTKNYEKWRDNRSENNFQVKKGSLFKQKTHPLSQDISGDKHMRNPGIKYSNEQMTQITTGFFSLMRKHPNGFKSTVMNELISEQVGFNFSHTQLNCRSEFEFLKKYIIPGQDKIDIEFVHDIQRDKLDNSSNQETQIFLVRSRSLFAEYVRNDEQQRKFVQYNEIQNSQKQKMKWPNQTEGTFSEHSLVSVPNPHFLNHAEIEDVDQLSYNKPYIPSNEALYGAHRPISNFDQTSHIKHQSAMTIDSNQINSVQHLQAARDKKILQSQFQGPQQMNYQQNQPYQGFYNYMQSNYSDQNVQAAGQIKMSKKALDAPSYTPHNGFANQIEEMNYQNANAAARNFDQVQINPNLGIGQSRNGPPQRQQVQSQVINAHYELFGTLARQPSQGENEDAALVDRGIEQMISSQDDLDHNEEVLSVFTPQTQDKLGQIFPGTYQAHSGTQDNQTGSSIMLKSFHPSSDSSSGNKTIFNEQQSHFGLVANNQPGSTKSQDFNVNFESVSALSHPQPNSLSNAKNYQPEFSINTHGQPNDHYLPIFGQGLSNISPQSAQEKETFKFSRQLEKPISEGHFQQRSQHFLTSNAQQPEQPRITEENSGGDDNTTNKSPEAHEEAGGADVGKKPDEDSEAK